MTTPKSNTEKNGVLLVNKRAGITSFDVLRDLKKEFPKGTALGHAGTLDPFATGILVVLVGKATKLSPFLLSSRKAYRAKMRFGCETDTGDLTGSAKPETAVPEFSLDALTEKLAKFCGSYTSQIPPMYSAKKIDGKKLYELAREGKEIEREAVAVSVGDAKALAWEAPVFEFKVSCSAGTYIRTLAEDFARSLGTAAHLVELHRTTSGKFAVEECSKFIEFDEVLDRSLGVEVDSATALAIVQGKALKLCAPTSGSTQSKEATWFPVFSEGKLIAVWDKEKQRSIRVFN